MKIILERRYGLKYNLKRIYRLMRVLGLRSVCRKKKRRYQKKTPAEYTAENILNREFSSDRQNEKWVTDITELKYGSGSKAYLSAVLDLYGRNIVAFSLSRRNNTPLVLDTFEQAFQKYPDAKPLLHSDRGVQYTSRSFRKEMKRAGVCQSMSRVGRCLDNAPMEGFWGILCCACHIMRHQRRVIAAHRTRRVEQRSQQILPDVANPRCILLQAVRDETNMFAVQLQQL